MKGFAIEPLTFNSCLKETTNRMKLGILVSVKHPLLNMLMTNKKSMHRMGNHCLPWNAIYCSVITHYHKAIFVVTLRSDGSNLFII